MAPHANNNKNGTTAASRAYPPGIHVPSLTFFRDNARQDIDWEVQEAHMEFLISSGLHGSKWMVEIWNRFQKESILDADDIV